MSVRHAVSIVAFIAGVTGGVLAQQAPQTTAPVFRSGVDLTLVDVVVRDKNGGTIKGLTAGDFELLEDGKRQQIVTFSFEEVTNRAAPVTSAPILAGATPTGVVSSGPLTSDAAAGHRLLVLAFDVSSAEPEAVQRSVDAAMKWVDEHMSPADLVAVASIGSALRVLSDFTTVKEQVRSALSALSSADGRAVSGVEPATPVDDGAAASDTGTFDAGAEELDTFNNDVRLRALKTLAQALAPVQQKKAIIYFSSGIERSGTDNQVELRAAINAAVRANVAIYPVDSRGLQAVVPGGSARQASRGGLAVFSAEAVANQFAELSEQHESLTTLATDTGGTAFTDTNDFGEVFAKVVGDVSSYYILGFASANTAKDGRFRRVAVRLRNKSGAQVEAREGYYADRDFRHTAKGDRETQLQEQLTAGLPATDVPLVAWAGWFRLAADRYYVPIVLALPGSALPPAIDKQALDVAGFIRDERGLPVGRIRDTIVVPPATTGSLTAKQVLYQTGVTLPPGRFSMKVVVRENTTGRMGTFETPVVVPELAGAPVKVSSLVFSTQIQSAGGRKSASPLVRDGLEIIPNLTRIVGRGQTLHVYYEVYDPAAETDAPHLRTSLAFYRDKVKVFETPVVERTALDGADRRAARFQFEIPAEDFSPGLYTCQVNIIDEVAGRFAFPRLELYVR